MTVYCEQSNKLELNKVKDEENIFLITQFFIHSNSERHKEILYCLKKNVENEYIHKIYLLNERIYSDEELGVKSDKIIQYDIKKRIKYKDIFEFVDEKNINGYIVFTNSDIFLDETLRILNHTNMSKTKTFMGLLRYEYNSINKSKSLIFGPRPDSQDTWIFHSSMNVDSDKRGDFDFHFGMPGCDNKLFYLLKTYKYTLLNTPHLLKTYHYHTTQIRNYNISNLIPGPYLWVDPFGYKTVRNYGMIRHS